MTLLTLLTLLTGWIYPRFIYYFLVLFSGKWVKYIVDMRSAEGITSAKAATYTRQDRATIALTCALGASPDLPSYTAKESQQVPFDLAIWSKDGLGLHLFTECREALKGFVQGAKAKAC